MLCFGFASAALMFFALTSFGQKTGHPASSVCQALDKYYFSVAFIFSDCEKIYVGNLEGVRQLILGSVYSNAGKLDVAKQCYIKAMKAGEANDDVHTSAFAAYELGMTLCRNPEVMYLTCDN